MPELTMDELRLRDALRSVVSCRYNFGPYVMKDDYNEYGTPTCFFCGEWEPANRWRAPKPGHTPDCPWAAADRLLRSLEDPTSS